MAYARSILKLGDHDYELVPVEKKKSQHSPKLRSFDDPSFRDTETYDYTHLEGSKKKIRLLQLQGGSIDSTDIYCQLTEVDYDNRFHMPTSPNVPGKYRGPQNAKGISAEEIEQDNLEAFHVLKEFEIAYEALSWCWDAYVPKYIIFINAKDRKGRDKLYKLRVTEQLALALKYLRYADRSRTLWIDAICINQEDPSERNHQVQMMPRIYTRAKQVCIWLGYSDEASKLAIPFIKHEMMELQHFETLFSDSRYAAKWKALIRLMQRDWFSRRWVVQEVTLGQRATIHCGADSIEWEEFAIAIELFVEVESATHRLSEVMQQDVKLRHVPGWFEYVSALGASLLVQATGKVFRGRRSSLDRGRWEHDISDSRMEIVRSYQTIDPLDRDSLLSLENLVSTLFIFGASEPRDAVYSMLALSRDAAPLAISSPSHHPHDNPTRVLNLACEPLLTKKPFPVDYRRPYTMFCKDFVSFAIQRRMETDPSQALDILCRPWALPPESGKSGRSKARRVRPELETRQRLFPARDIQKLPWKKLQRDPKNQWQYLKERETLDLRSMEQYWEDSAKTEVWQSSDDWRRKVKKYFSGRSDRNKQVYEDFPLPSWVAQISRAPIGLHFHPGVEPRITGRSNADPLVGYPKDGHRNYNAAQTRAPRQLRFRRRPLLKHYSLFVEGVVIDEVDEVVAASQGGNIPKSWLYLARWHDPSLNPPSEFWRTLVADRGRDNRNPPYYYAMACREAAIRGGIESGRIDTSGVINNERNPIVIEFCRRVHEVIWNRHLFQTKAGRLGLAFEVQKGDKICVLYGCTVPVVLHQHTKAPEDLDMEAEEDSIESLKSRVQKMEIFRQRKANHVERNLSAEELEDNRKARTESIRISEALGGTQLNTVKRVSKNRGYSSKEEHDGLRSLTRSQHGREHENSQKNSEVAVDLEDQKELQPEGQQGELRAGQPTEQNERNQASQERKEQSHMVYGKDGDYYRTDDSQGSGFIQSVTNTTEYNMLQDAAKAEDPHLWYELRSDCYLHGMMEGEAIREHFHRRIVERTFELR